MGKGLILLVLLLGLTSAGLALEGKAGRHYDQAMALAEKGRFKDARIEMKVALALAPESLLVQKALEAIEAGKKPGQLQADPEASAANADISLAKAKADKVASEGQAAYRKSELDIAGEAWRRALVLDPENQVARDGLTALSLEKYLPDSDQPFDQTIGELYVAAMRELRKDHFVEARAKLDEALKLNPIHQQSKRLLARVETAALVQQGSRDAEMLCRHASRLLEDGSLVEARKAFERALETDPSISCAKAGILRQASLARPQVKELLKLGREVEKAGEHGKAEGYYARALELAPGDEAARKGLAVSAGKADLAKSHAKRKREADRWYNQGVESWEAGHLAEAADFFKKSLELNPDDLDTPLALKKVRERLDARSAEDAREAGRLFADGQLLEDRGQIKEALDIYHKALTRDPTHAKAKSAAARLEGELR